MTGRSIYLTFVTHTDTTAGPLMCWPWTGKADGGYGLIERRGKQIRATHVALELADRPVREGEFALHECDTPSCVNPAHLYSGTMAQNTADARNRGRLVVGARHPLAKLTDERVRAMRHDRMQGMTLDALAAKYQVSVSTAHRAITRQTWNHVQ